jgi:glycosyltransferase involved in cell wall biosynthesis
MGAAAAGGRPLVISLHGSDVFVAERHGLAGRAARAAFRRAAWVTACSEDLRDRAVALGAVRARTTVIPYGVDSAQFRPGADLRAAGRAALGLADDVPLVLAVGRLARKKGFEYLIEAAAMLAPRYPALRVVIAGAGDLDASLRAQAAAAGVDASVVFSGVVSHDQVPALLAAADVAVVPSVHDEAGNVDGLPNTVLEIMASGTPLVATGVGGIGAVAVDGRTARLVPERNAAALAEAIADLFDHPSQRRAIGEEARAAICRDYSWARVAEQFTDIYARVSDRPASHP